MKKMPNDMVFDHNMNPAWCDTPENIINWLHYQLEHNPRRIAGYTVRTGWPQEYLTVSEYLDRRPVDDTEGTNQ